MSIRDPVPSATSGSTTATDINATGGQASGQHQGLHRPSDDQRVEQALDDVGLEDQGDVLEDQLRDRRSRGGPPQEDSGEEVDQNPGAPA